MGSSSLGLERWWGFWQLTQAAHVNTFLQRLLEMFASVLRACLLCCCPASPVRQGRWPRRDEDSHGQKGCSLSRKIHSRARRETLPCSHMRHKLIIPLKKKKKKKRTLFCAGKGFLKEAMQASCFWTSTRKSPQKHNPLRQQLKSRNRLLEEPTAVRLHPVSGRAKCFFHHLFVLWGL